MKTNILVVDCDRRSRKLISSLLEKKHNLILVKSISDAYSVLSSSSPDILIIDPEFPKKDGLEFIKYLRGFSNCPILAVSANSTENAAVSAFEAGADDYIRKPFFSSELVARIDAAINRIKIIEAAVGNGVGSVYRRKDLSLDFNTQSVFLNNKRIHLTKNELKILVLLCKNPNKVLTYDYIIKSVWGPKINENTGILRVNIANLRKKLEDTSKESKYLHTENGIGYRMAENEAVSS